MILAQRKNDHVFDINMTKTFKSFAGEKMTLARSKMLLGLVRILWETKSN